MTSESAFKLVESIRTQIQQVKRQKIELRRNLILKEATPPHSFWPSNWKEYGFTSSGQARYWAEKLAEEGLLEAHKTDSYAGENGREIGLVYYTLKQENGTK